MNMSAPQLRCCAVPLSRRPAVASGTRSTSSGMTTRTSASFGKGFSVVREPIRAIHVTPGIARTTLTNCKTARRRCSHGDGSGGTVRLNTAIPFTSATRTWSIARAPLVVIPIQLQRKIRTENLRDAPKHASSANPRRNRAVSPNIGGNCSSAFRVTPKVTPTEVWLPVDAIGRRYTCKRANPFDFSRRCAPK
jgi:hypothetical protein